MTVSQAGAMTEPAQGHHTAMRGTNQSGMRAWNERLVLTLLRTEGAVSKADIARITGLSAQTVSVIMRALESDGFLEKGDPVRGRVGQPSVPMSLSPTGAYFFGLKIGRRSSEMVLTDFRGAVLGRCIERYHWPLPQAATQFAARAVAELRQLLPAGHDGRIAGMGIAMPFQLWDWTDAMGAPQSELNAWRDFDLRAEIASAHEFPVLVQKDTTAACGAELVFGSAQLPRNFVYYYIGFFIGGGIVLNGSLLPGLRGNAGALGSMPVPGDNGEMAQLIDRASIAVLERWLTKRGISPDALWADGQSWDIPDDLLTRWIDGTGAAIAHSILSAQAVFDFESVLIDGWCPQDVRARIVECCRATLQRLNHSGLHLPDCRAGTLGHEARTLGAAALPLTERFQVDRNVLLMP